MRLHKANKGDERRRMNSSRPKFARHALKWRKKLRMEPRCDAEPSAEHRKANKGLKPSRAEPRSLRAQRNEKTASKETSKDGQQICASCCFARGFCSRDLFLFKDVSGSQSPSPSTPSPACAILFKSKSLATRTHRSHKCLQRHCLM